MKKLLFGCLGILVLAGILFAVGSYILYRAASPLVDSARGYLSDLAKIGELDKDIVNQSAFAPPVSGELTQAQVERFARVQESVQKALGQRMNEIEEKYKRFKVNAEKREQPSIGEVLSGLGDIANVFMQARRFQVNALNEEKFSQAEYSWVRDRVFQAAGKEAVSYVDLKQIADAVRDNTGVSVDTSRTPSVPLPVVPEKNRELVKPYLDRMDRWIPLAFFGF
jgi:hypothetical protein